MTDSTLSSNQTTQDVDVDEVICALLRTVRAFVDTMPVSAWRRAIDGLVRKLELETNRWSAVPPSRGQRSAMIELITALEVEIRGGVSARPPR